MVVSLHGMSADLALHRRDACFSRVAHTEEDENEDNKTSFGEWKVHAVSKFCVKMRSRIG